MKSKELQNFLLDVENELVDFPLDQVLRDSIRAALAQPQNRLLEKELMTVFENVEKINGRWRIKDYRHAEYFSAAVRLAHRRPK